jgi:hypothetical protein
MTQPTVRSQDTDDGPETQEPTHDDSPESDDNTSPHFVVNHDKANSDPTLDPACEMDIFSFHVGQFIDVLDSIDRWSEAEVHNCITFA